MNQSFFGRRIFISVVALFLLFTGCFVFYQNSRERAYRSDVLQLRLQDFNMEVYNMLDVLAAMDSLKKEPHANIRKLFMSDETASFVRLLLEKQNQDGLRLTLIWTNGEVFFDSSHGSDDYSKYGNHLNRKEVRTAIEKGEGQGVIRSSETMGADYYYSATYQKDHDYIVRSALPYNTLLKHSLGTDQHYLWFAGLITVILIIIFSYVTHKMGSSLNDKENLLAHLRISKEGLGIFDEHRCLVLSNSLFNQYGNLISDVNMSLAEDILYIPEMAPVLEFLENTEKAEDRQAMSRESSMKGKGGRNIQSDFKMPHSHREQEPCISLTIEKGGRIFSVDCVRFVDGGFEISINDVTHEEEQSRLKHQLTQNIAHELKTPVSSILGYLETIIDAQKSGMLPPDKMLHFLERSYSQCERLNNLVQDISMLSKMGDTSRIVNKENIDVCNMVHDMLQEVELKLESVNMKVDNQLPSSLIIKGNHSLVYSIFRNLTDNAIAYAGEGTTITIRMFRVEDGIYYFSFADNGVGVEDQHLSRIFERFYRVDKGRSRKFGGTGLGLAIVKNAVMLHGGSITAKCRPGGGLEFIFTLEG